MRPGGTELEPHALVGVLTVVHERIDRPQTLEQRRQHLLAPPEDERPALLQLGWDQPAGVGPRRDAGAALTLVERPGLVVATELAGEVDRMQVPFAVLLQGKQRERRREAVGHTGLHRDARAELAQHGVEVDALGVADRPEREAIAGLRDRGLVLTALLEQVIHQPAGAHLALVARKRCAPPKKASDVASDPPRLNGPPWIPRVSRCA